MPDPRKYRKRPVVVEAMQYDGANDFEIIRWAERHGGSMHVDNDGAWHLSVPTLEGTMRAYAGDWIVRGVVGEFYPVKPSIFEATYEEAPDA